MSAKDVQLHPITRREAEAVITRHHYSGKVKNNGTLHMGAFLDGRIEGAMQLGPPIDKRRMLGLVEGTQWDNMLELNRMAFSDRLPPNSESRSLAVMARVLRQHAPQIKWIVSFADGTQCGDGTIYRAAGYLLTQIKRSTGLARFPNGEVLHQIALQSQPTAPQRVAGGRSYYDLTGGRHSWTKFLEATGGVVIPGYQLRYIQFVDPTWRDRLVCPVLPYSAITDAGAGMYRGQKR